MPYDPEFKAEVLKMRAQGYSRPVISKRKGVHVETIERWEKQAKAPKAKPKKDTPVTSTDIIQIGDGATNTFGMLEGILAEQMPRGTTAELWKAIVMQKIARALDGADFPKPRTMADVKTLVSLGNLIQGVGAKPAGKAAGQATVVVRLDRLGRKPGGVVEAEVVEDSETEE